MATNLRVFEKAYVSDFKSPQKMYKEALRTLKDVRRLITKAWARGAYRYDVASVGGNVRGVINDKNAKVAYCLVGALQAVDGPAEAFAEGVLYTCLPPDEKNRAEAAESNIISFNDNTDLDIDKQYKRVVALVDRGIKKLERKLEKA